MLLLQLLLLMHYTAADVLSNANTAVTTAITNANTTTERLSTANATLSAANVSLSLAVEGADPSAIATANTAVTDIIFY